MTTTTSTMTTTMILKMAKTMRILKMRLWKNSFVRFKVATMTMNSTMRVVSIEVYLHRFGTVLGLRKRGIISPIIGLRGIKLDWRK
jgi:hypothetical protein